MTSNIPSAVATYFAAEEAHDQNRLSGDDYIAALRDLDAWQPATPRDFVHKFIAMCNDGNPPNHERLQRLIEEARAIVAIAPAPDRWTAAFQAEQEAREAAERFHVETVQRTYRAYDAGEASWDEVTAAEETYGSFSSALYGAVGALLETAAPSWWAVAKKLRMGCEEGYFDASDEAHKALQAILADVERLSGEA